MTYNEWRDELKNNLLTVTDSERRRVLDYYAEAYADRREAGFTEREIIEGFGAPYDAAQRILNEGSDDYYQDNGSKSRAENRGRKNHAPYDDEHDERDSFYEQEEKKHQRRSEEHANKKNREDYTWIFVLLCIIFAIPIFGVVMGMVGITIGLCVAPFGVLISGLGSVIAGISTMFHDLPAGAFMLGEGLLAMGVGIILIPLCIKLVKLMWKLFKMFFGWLKRLFSGKEKAHE